MLAGELCAVPLQEVVGGAAYAGRGGEDVQATLAAVLLIVDGPADADEGEEDEGEDLEEVGGVGEQRVDGEAEVGAEEEDGDEGGEDLGGEEELATEPDEGLGCGVRAGVAGGGCGQGDDRHDDGGYQGSVERAAEVGEQGLAAAGEDEAGQRGDDGAGQEAREAEGGGAFEGSAAGVGAEPEGVAGEADVVVGNEGGGAAAAVGAVVEVPELGLPGAEPVRAVGGGDERGHQVQDSTVWFG